MPYRQFFLNIRRGTFVHPRGYRVYKSFGYVKNSAYQLRRLLECDPEAIAGRTFYLCDYAPIEVLTFARMIAETWGRRPPREVPEKLLRIAARVGDALAGLGMRNPPLTSFRLDNLLTEMLHETAPLEAICGPLPYDLQTGVAETIVWLDAQGLR